LNVIYGDEVLQQAMKRELGVLKCILISFSICYTMATLVSIILGAFFVKYNDFGSYICDEGQVYWGMFYCFNQILFEQLPLGLLFWYH
jgi:hypothetical protein